ncbi:hypothetical protein AB0K14_29990 [Actinosynnema sp. NPDC050801]|uniref:hypothetical protein n=1 Tax=unclassified Actinosynnema TaxID=2637065 RepID=UPI00340C7D2E
MTTSGFAARGARSVAFAVTSTALACAAHVVGSGGLPDIGTTILLTALLAFAGRALAGRWWGTAGVVALLGLSQVVLHVMLTWLSGLSHHGFEPTAAMLVGHACAAVLTGLVPARAEAAVFAIARALASWWPEPLTPLGARRPLWVVTAPRDPAVVPDVLRRAHARRGPPFDS